MGQKTNKSEEIFLPKSQEIGKKETRILFVGVGSSGKVFKKFSKTKTTILKNYLVKQFNQMDYEKTKNVIIQNIVKITNFLLSEIEKKNFFGKESDPSFDIYVNQKIPFIKPVEEKEMNREIYKLLDYKLILEFWRNEFVLELFHKFFWDSSYPFPDGCRQYI
jgi:hypothetical protein